MAEDPDEIEKLWIAEAKRRAQEFQDNPSIGIPAEEVFKKISKAMKIIIMATIEDKIRYLFSMIEYGKLGLNY